MRTIGSESGLKKVCCASNKTIKMLGLDGVPNGVQVSGDAPEGTFCGIADELCDSGFCGQNQLCTANKLDAFEPCSRDGQCKHRCGFANAESQETVCCRFNGIFRAQSETDDKYFLLVCCRTALRVKLMTDFATPGRAPWTASASRQNYH